MPQKKLPDEMTRPGRVHPGIVRFEPPDVEAGTPFTQTSSSAGTEGSLSPHQLFSFFTYEIILEKKVFVR
jgi:hypothetical protein